MLKRLAMLHNQVVELHAAAVADNPEDLNGEVTLLADLDMALGLLLLVDPEERMAKIRALSDELSRGLSLSASDRKTYSSKVPKIRKEAILFDAYGVKLSEPKAVVVENLESGLWLSIPELSTIVDTEGSRVLLEYHTKPIADDETKPGWYLYVWIDGDDEDPHKFHLTEFEGASES